MKTPKDFLILKRILSLWSGRRIRLSIDQDDERVCERKRHSLQQLYVILTYRINSPLDRSMLDFVWGLPYVD